jgi:hypothetical protein
VNLVLLQFVTYVPIELLCYPILWLWRVKSGNIYERNMCRYAGKVGRWSDDTDDDDDDDVSS